MRLQGLNYAIHSEAYDKAKILMAFSFIFDVAIVNGTKVGSYLCGEYGKRLRSTSVSVNVRP